MKILVAIVVIGTVLLVALVMGYDGVLMASGIGIIAGLGGFSAGTKKRPP